MDAAVILFALAVVMLVLTVILYMVLSSRVDDLKEQINGKDLLHTELHRVISRDTAANARAIESLDKRCRDWRDEFQREQQRLHDRVARGAAILGEYELHEGIEEEEEEDE